MANILVDDLANNTQFSTMTMEDVSRAFREGVRAGDEASVFLNVRTWNIWLRAEKKKVAPGNTSQQNPNPFGTTDRGFAGKTLR